MRRLRKILFFIILSAWTLTSCEKDTGTETVNVPIGFSNNVTTATRAGDINNDNLTSIGVFASLTHGNFDATVSTPQLHVQSAGGKEKRHMAIHSPEVLAKQ
ncbi:fimbrillin family protein [Phocaeicola dorei]|uniref:fimbrillin family protein n=1 Tax=Phocaeicola dorei TaxID=357276 RepID=UPI0022E565F1|nr:fimbrillin family protein [Phocaeicola dorei]